MRPIHPLPMGPIKADNFGVGRPSKHVRPRIDYEEEHEVLMRREIRGRIDARKIKIDGMLSDLLEAQREEMRWRDRVANLEEKLVTLTEQQQIDYGLRRQYEEALRDRSRLNVGIDVQGEDNVTELGEEEITEIDLPIVDDSEEEHEIREIGVIDLPMFNDIDDISDIGLEGIEPDTDNETG